MVFVTHWIVKKRVVMVGEMAGIVRVTLVAVVVAVVQVEVVVAMEVAVVAVEVIKRLLV